MAVFVAASAPQLVAASEAASRVAHSSVFWDADAAGAAASGSAPSSAPSNSGAASSAHALAEQRYREGAESLDRGDFEAARLAFVQAYALDPKPRYLYSLATAETKSGHPVEALAHLRDYLKLPALTETDRSAASLLMADAASRTPAGGATPPVAAGAPVRAGAETAAPVALGARAAPQTPSEEASTPNGKPLPTTKWIVTAGLVGGGLLSFGIAGAVSAASTDQASKEADLSAQTGVCLQPPMTAGCSALKSAADSRATDGNVSIGFVVAGSALVVAGVLSLIFWPAGTAETPAAKSRGPTGFLAPLILTRGAGAQWATPF